MIQRDIEPDIITYNSLMDGYCLRGEMDEAKKVFDLMASKGSMVNTRSYNILINGYLRRIQEAENLFCKMKGCGQLPNVRTYAGEIQSARDLLCGLSSKGLQPDVRTYNVMISGLCNEGLVSEAEKVLREMEEKGCFPNGFTYNIIIRGFITNNETSRAMGFIEEMVERGFSADASTAELVVDLLSKDKVDPALLPLLKIHNKVNLKQNQHHRNLRLVHL
ncbi:hypothetical protein M0R45_014727 [Rubus argutus]|uniref:Pentatricopeptide repeat-containing protein n=1 Tax=Rubus argutus TaxID=59490 RepID=A0AAW1XPS5_RUBAR